MSNQIKSNSLYINKKFNMITLLYFSYIKNKKTYYKSICDCGTIKNIRLDSVISGKTKSCGCLKLKKFLKRITTHSKSKSSEYISWHHMRQRCLNKNNKSYHNYGGRGIKICNKWLNFENFYKDMGNRPPNTSLDRINNDKGYYKENCRWATRKEQLNNKRNNVMLCYLGKSMSINDWSKLTGININTIYGRMYRGLSINNILKK